MARSRTGGRPGRTVRANPAAPKRRRVRIGFVLLALVALAVLLGGRWWFAGDPATAATDSHITTPYLVVIGVEHHDHLTDADRALLDTGTAQTALLRVPTADDQCAAAGWASLSAGELVDTGAICRPDVTQDGAIADWTDLQAAAGGRLGGLAEQSTGCVSAIGPSAALGATRSDGTVSVYQSFSDFEVSGFLLPCPLTLVDAPSDEDAAAAVTTLSEADDVTVIMTGLGPDHDGSAPQLFYRTGTTLPGLNVGDDQQAGWLTLTDLGDALRTFVDAEVAAPLQVSEAPTSAAQAQDLLNAVRQLADRDGFRNAGLLAVLVGAALLVGAGLLRRSGTTVPSRIVAAAAASWPAGLLVTGLSGWWRAETPLLIGVLVAVGATVVGTAVALLMTRGLSWPPWLTGAAVTTGVGAVLAVWGGPGRAGSLLDRFYLDDDGFGSAATAVTAVAALVVLGHLAAFGWRWLVGVLLLAAALWAGGAGWATIGFLAAGAVVMWLLRVDAQAPAYRWLGGAPVAMVAAFMAAGLVALRVAVQTQDVVEVVPVLLGLGCWTIVHSWLVRGPAGEEFDLAALRVPVLLAVTVIAVLTPDPGWAWLLGSLSFGSVAAAHRVLGVRRQPHPADA